VFPEERAPRPLPINPKIAESAPTKDLVTTTSVALELSAQRCQSHEDVALNTGVPEEIRCYAIMAFGKTPGAQSFPVMQRLVWDPIPAVRYTCAGMLSHFPGIMALPLLRRLLKDENPFVRSAAVHSIGSWKTPHILASLFRALADKSKLVRQTVRETIRTFLEETLVPTFQKAMRRMRPVAVLRGIKFLWESQHPEAVPLLNHVLRTSSGPTRRVLLRFAMKTGHPSLMYDIKSAIRTTETETLIDLQNYLEYCHPASITFTTLFTYVKKLEQLTPLARSAHLKKLLDHADAHVRTMAVRSLGDINLEGLYDDLVKLYEREQNTSVRVCILEIFPKFREEAEPVLLTALSTDEPAILQAAIRGLSEVGGQHALDRLAQVAKARIPATAKFFVECAIEKISERLNASRTTSHGERVASDDFLRAIEPSLDGPGVR